MQFSPAFPLLAKFNFGLKTDYKDENDVLAVSEYLGIGLPDVSLDNKIAILAEELDSQNAFLSKHLISDSIYNTIEYSKSKFVQEIVANNRQNLRNRATRDRGLSEDRSSKT